MRYVSYVTNQRSAMRIRRIAGFSDARSDLEIGLISAPLPIQSATCTDVSQSFTINVTQSDRVKNLQGLFDIVGDSFFSILASKNKHIYFRALMVLRECYQGELRFRRGDLAAYLIDHM